MTDKLTPASARDAGPGTVLRDHEVKGLELHVGTQKRTWRLYYRTRAGDERRPRVGYFPEFSLSRARDIARDWKDRVARGEDPSAEFQAARAAPKVEELCDRYLRDYAERRKQPRSVREDRLLIEAHIKPGLGSRRVAEVQKLDVDRFLDDVRQRRYVARGARRGDRREAPGAANHVRALLSKMFNLAETDFGMRPQHSNPVRGTRLNYMPKRKRMASKAELRRLVDTLGDLAPHWPGEVAATWVLMFTGARVGEITNAAPQHYDGVRLSLPNHKTVRHVGDRKIYVPRPARDILQTMPLAGERLFISGTLQRFWAEVRRRADLGDLQLRDFRRLWASVALSNGLSLEQIGEHYGHTQAQTTLGYSWLMQDEEADQGVDRVAEALLKRAGVSRPAASASRFVRRRRVSAGTASKLQSAGP